jgi:hypothetical protein
MCFFWSVVLLVHGKTFILFYDSEKHLPCDENTLFLVSYFGMLVCGAMYFAKSCLLLTFGAIM